MGINVNQYYYYRYYDYKQAAIYEFSFYTTLKIIITITPIV